MPTYGVRPQSDSVFLLCPIRKWNLFLSLPTLTNPQWRNIKFDAMLADSASFMAAVSNLRSSQSSPRTVASPGKQEHVNVNDESRLKQDFLLSHDEGSDDIEPDEPLDSGVDLKAKKIIDETQKKNAAEATSVAPDNADMELEQPIVDTIEVFRSPSIKNENQTDSSKPKVACGFKSSLPQPGVFMRRRKPPINKPQTDDHDDLDSLPRSSASSTIVLEPAFSSTSQATGESMGHEQSSNATETPTHLEQKASQGADESMAPQKDVESERKELMELEETLSKATLPASVRNFLQARKEQLEGLIYLRATRPVDPATINQPSKEVAGRPRGTSVQARASQTEVPTLIRETAQDSQAPAMTARPKVMFALATRPAMEPIARKPDVVRAFEALDAVRNDEENIIGNHLLPGRTPMIPVAPTPVPASAPAPVATASQTLYGTQLKMRETPYLPQTAAAKQYAGLSSQASPPMPTSSHQRTQQQGALRAPRQSVTNAGCGALSPPSRGRAADRDRGHKRLDSKVSASDSGPSGGSSQASGNSNIMNRGQANLRKASARTTNEPLKSILNDQFVSRRIAGNANQAPKVPESPVGGLAGSKWVVDDELQDKAEKPRKSASSDLESSIWASSDDKNKDKGLSASRWAH